MTNYHKYLTPQERVQCLRFGAVLKCAERGITPKQFMKQAAWYDVPATALKTVAALAVVTGVPIGIAAHVINRHVTKERTKERDLKEQIKYYQNAAGGLQSGLKPGVTGVQSEVGAQQ